MNHLDELFRGGLGDRKPDVPADLWQKIAARKGEIPAGESLDHLFADKLANRQAAVPANMWDRITAARQPTRGRFAAALLLLLLASLAWFTDGQRATPAAGQTEVARTQVPGLFPIADRSGSETDVPVPTEPTSLTQTSPPTGTGPAPAVTAREAAEDRSTPIIEDRTTSDVPPPVAWTETNAASATSPLPSENYGVAPGEFLPAPRPVAADRSFTGGGSRRPQGELLLGAVYAHQRFSLRDGDRALRDAREVSEFPELSWQLSARVRYQLLPRFSLTTGITYAEIRNQLEYEAMENGTPTLLRQSNHLRLLEVPFLAGFELSGGRLRLSLNAGPVVNVFSAVSGQYLRPDQPEPLDLTDSGHYRSNVGVGFTTSLTTTYKLGATGTTRLLLEPFFKSYPRSFTRPDAPLGEHYWTAGLQLGLRRSF